METTTITPAPEQITPIKLDINGYKAEITPNVDMNEIRVETNFEKAAVLPKIAQCHGINLLADDVSYRSKYDIFCKKARLVHMQDAMQAMQAVLSEHMSNLCQVTEKQTPLGTTTEYRTNSQLTAVVRDHIGEHTLSDVTGISFNKNILTITVYSATLQPQGYKTYGIHVEPQKSKEALFEELQGKFKEYIRQNNGCMNGYFDLSPFLTDI